MVLPKGIFSMILSLIQAFLSTYYTPDIIVRHWGRTEKHFVALTTSSSQNNGSLLTCYAIPANLFISAEYYPSEMQPKTSVFIDQLLN
jgi:hypothetical protein